MNLSLLKLSLFQYFLCSHSQKLSDRLSKYLLLEIKWDDYVLYYILKYITIYVRIDWPSLITRPTHTKGPKFLTKIFVDITYTHTSNILAFGGTGSPTRRVSFSGYLHANAMQISKPQIAPKMYLSGQIFSRKLLFWNRTVKIHMSQH